MFRRTFFKTIAAGLAGLGLGLSAKEKPPEGEPILHDNTQWPWSRSLQHDPLLYQQLIHHKGQVVDWDEFAGKQGRDVTYLYAPEYAMTFVTLGKRPSKDNPIYVFVGDDRRLVLMDHAWPGGYDIQIFEVVRRDEQHVPTYAVTKDKVLSTLLETPIDRKCIYLYKRGDNEWGGLATPTPINFSELRENVKVGVSNTALLWSCRNKTMTFGHHWSANIHVSNPRS
jgi:hypothetical protein